MYEGYYWYWPWYILCMYITWDDAVTGLKFAGEDFRPQEPHHKKWHLPTLTEWYVVMAEW